METPVQPLVPVTVQDLMASLADSPQSNQARADLLLKNFRGLGCSEAVMSPIADSPHSNVVCRLDGATGVTVVVGAHYDKTSKGKGVADNWTGVTLLSYLYAEMAAQRPQHTFVFVGFAEEEIDSAGASHFVDNMSSAELHDLIAMINLDTLGLDLMQADPRSSRVLRQKLNCAALATGLEVAPANLYRWIVGDWEPFKAAGVPVLNLHSLSLNRSRLIHSNRDSILVVKKDEYINSFRLVRQLLLELDASMSGSGDPHTVIPHVDRN
jgi:hypothetical protein